MVWPAMTGSGAGNGAHAQEVSCTCRYKGQDYGIGESICLKGPGGMRMATCSMVLNNTSWKFSEGVCPVSALEDRQPNMTPIPGMPEIPVVTASNPESVAALDGQPIPYGRLLASCL